MTAPDSPRISTPSRRPTPDWSWWTIWLPGRNRPGSRSPQDRGLMQDTSDAADAPSKSKDRRTPLLLALIVLLGLALRVWGIGWSLPDARHPLATYHPDERIDLSAAQQA